MVLIFTWIQMKLINRHFMAFWNCFEHYLMLCILMYGSHSVTAVSHMTPGIYPHCGMHISHLDTHMWKHRSIQLIQVMSPINTFNNPCLWSHSWYTFTSSKLYIISSIFQPHDTIVLALIAPILIWIWFIVYLSVFSSNLEALWRLSLLYLLHLAQSLLYSKYLKRLTLVVQWLWLDALIARPGFDPWSRNY